jgi:hypothetical protein
MKSDEFQWPTVYPLAVKRTPSRPASRALTAEVTNMIATQAITAALAAIRAAGCACRRSESNPASIAIITATAAGANAGEKMRSSGGSIAVWNSVIAM